MIAERYRTDYTGEFLITQATWSGGKKRQKREWVANPIENQHISGRAVCIGSDGDEAVSKVFDQRRQNPNFGRFAAFGKANHKISGLNHAQIAVNGIRCVQKNSRGTRRIEGSHNFLGNDGTFSNASSHQTTAGRSTSTSTS